MALFLCLCPLRKHWSKRPVETVEGSSSDDSSKIVNRGYFLLAEEKKTIKRVLNMYH